MKYRTGNLILVLAISLSTACRDKQSHKEQRDKSHPNIIYILADDLGYGDLSVYGQKHFGTPNIDALAEGGIRFTQHYSGSTVCAPSRSALLSGQHTGHTFIRGNKEVMPEGQYPIADSVVTLAEILKTRGYATGIFGKWGLGYPGSEGEPLSQGFDRFYGYNCQRMGHNYYPYALWDDRQQVKLRGNAGEGEGTYAPELIHRETLKFIEEQKDGPFFAYVASIIPHAELKVPERYLEKYRGKFLPENAFEGCDPGCEHYKIGGYGSQPETHAAFAAMVSLLDEQVGEIVNKLKELGLEENTLIIFSSDNGPHVEGGADPDYFDSNGIYRGYKRDLYEGGIRVPMIARWPGVIQAGRVTDHVSAFWDVLPTIAEVTGAELPADTDGISFLPALLGEEQPLHEYLYWEFHELGGRVALRKGKWKAVRYEVQNDPGKPAELYDLSKDPGEEDNVASLHPEILSGMERLMDEAHTDSEAFPFGRGISQDNRK